MMISAPMTGRPVRSVVATGVAAYGSGETGPVKHGWVVTRTRVFADPEKYPVLWSHPKGGAAAPPPSESG